MKRLLIVVYLIINISTHASAQLPEGLFKTLMFGRTNTAAGEAMGRTGHLLGGGSVSHLFNPAALHYENGVSETYSRGNRLFIYGNGEYTYSAASARLNDHSAFAVSRKSFNTGESFDYVNEYKVNLATISYSYRVSSGFSFGANLNRIDQDISEFYFFPFMFG